MTSELCRKTVLMVAPEGGQLDLVSADGEVLAEFPVEPGRHSAGQFLDLVSEGQELQIAGGIVPMNPPHRIRKLDMGETQFESAANPDFKITNATRQAREMEIRLNRMEVLERSLKLRERASQRATAPAPVTPAAAPVVVSEDTVPVTENLSE